MYTGCCCHPVYTLIRQQRERASSLLHLCAGWKLRESSQRGNEHSLDFHCSVARERALRFQQVYVYARVCVCAREHEGEKRVLACNLSSRRLLSLLYFAAVRRAPHCLTVLSGSPLFFGWKLWCRVVVSMDFEVCTFFSSFRLEMSNEVNNDSSKRTKHFCTCGYGVTALDEVDFYFSD